MTEDRLKEIEASLAKITPPDCGDSSCLFGTSKGGMRTNGGCRCYRDCDVTARRFVHLLKDAPTYVKELLHEVRNLQFLKLKHEELLKVNSDQAQGLWNLSEQNVDLMDENARLREALERWIHLKCDHEYAADCSGCAAEYIAREALTQCSRGEVDGA